MAPSSDTRTGTQDTTRDRLAKLLYLDAHRGDEYAERHWPHPQHVNQGPWLERASAVISVFHSEGWVGPAQAAQMARERDLAVAHDRQPYPTADAHEATCHALEFYRGIARDATALLSILDGGRQDVQDLRARFEGGAGEVGRPDTGSLAARLTAAEGQIAELRDMHEAAVNVAGNAEHLLQQSRREVARLRHLEDAARVWAAGLSAAQKADIRADEDPAAGVLAAVDALPVRTEATE